MAVIEKRYPIAIGSSTVLLLLSAQAEHAGSLLWDLNFFATGTVALAFGVYGLVKTWRRILFP